MRSYALMIVNYLLALYLPTKRLSITVRSFGEAVGMELNDVASNDYRV